MGLKSVELEAANKGRGCLGKAAATEPVFILRAQDKFAPIVIDVWASLVRNATDGVSRKANEASSLADFMREWQRINGSKIPD